MEYQKDLKIVLECRLVPSFIFKMETLTLALKICGKVAVRPISLEMNTLFRGC